VQIIKMADYSYVWLQTRVRECSLGFDIGCMPSSVTPSADKTAYAACSAM